MAPTALYTDSKTTGTRPRVLVVDDEADVLGAIQHTLGQELDCKFIAARSLGEAQRIIEQQAVELLVTDVHLPDGDGTALLPILRRHQPNAHAIVITGSPTVDGAVTALRHGAVDFVTKPFNATDFAGRVNRALKRQTIVARNERRLDKLRDAVKRLNDARRTVTKKVDLLCNDLISAYGELSKQLDLVRVQEGFKNFLGDGKDLEQLLCHTMDYVMRQMGYCNIAIWLAGEEQHDFQLGAYMKYTIAGEDDLTAAMKGGIVKLADTEAFIRLCGDEAQAKLTEAELDYLADQDVMAVNCTYLGETLAVIVLFRDAAKGFVDADVATLKTISPLFALSLAGVVRDAQKDAAEVAEEDGAYADDDEDAEEREERRKKDDWWKTGGPPPF
jgi:FixJ family two-component response regulator